MTTYPDLGDWGGLVPGEVDPDAVARAEALAWGTMLQLTAGAVVVEPVVLLPMLPADTTDATVLTLERPVGRVIEVRTNDAILSPALWRQEEASIRRTDGQSWPTAQDLTAAVPELQVTYYAGRLPGPSFIWATGQLAAEFYLASAGSIRGGRKCRLPDSVTAVTRQGVSYQVPAGAFADGVTGIKEIDAVIRLYNPNLLSQRSLVMSPDSLLYRGVRIA